MLGRDDETVKGVTAATEQDPNEKEVLAEPAPRAHGDDHDHSDAFEVQDTPETPEDASDGPENNTGSGDVEITYKGRRTSYKDSQTGLRFNRNESVEVSQEDADRLLAQPGFVRASN